MRKKTLKSVLALFLSVAMVLSLVGTAALAVGVPQTPGTGATFAQKTAYLTNLKTTFLAELQTFIETNQSDNSVALNQVSGYKAGIGLLETIAASKLLNETQKNSIITDAVITGVADGLTNSYQINKPNGTLGTIAALVISFPIVLEGPVPTINQYSINLLAGKVVPADANLADIYGNLADQTGFSPADEALMNNPPSLPTEASLTNTDVQAVWDAVQAYLGYYDLYQRLDSQYQKEHKLETVASANNQLADAIAAVEAFLNGDAKRLNFNPDFLNAGLSAINAYQAIDATDIAAKFAALEAVIPVSDCTLLKFILTHGDNRLTNPGSIAAGQARIEALEADIVTFNNSDALKTVIQANEYVKKIKDYGLENTEGFKEILAILQTVTNLPLAELNVDTATESDLYAANSVMTGAWVKLGAAAVAMLGLNQAFEPFALTANLESAIEAVDVSTLSNATRTIGDLSVAYRNFHNMIAENQELLVDIMGFLGLSMDSITNLLDPDAVIDLLAPAIQANLPDGVNLTEEQIKELLGLANQELGGQIPEINPEDLPAAIISVSGKIACGLEKLAAGLVDLQTIVNNAKDKAIETHAAVKNLLEVEIPNLIDKWEDQLEALQGQIEAELYNQLTGLIGDIREDINDAKDCIRNGDIAETYQKILDIYGKVAEFIRLADGVVDCLEDAKPQLENWLENVLPGLLDQLEADIRAQIESCLDDAKRAALEEFLGLVQDLREDICEDIADALDCLKNSDLAAALAKAWDIYQKIDAFIDDTKDYFENEEYQPILDALKDLRDQVEDFLKGLPTREEIADAIQDKINEVLGILDNAIRQLPNISLGVDPFVDGNDATLNGAADSAILRVNYRDVFTYANIGLTEVQQIFDRYHVDIDLGELDAMDLYTFRFVGDSYGLTVEKFGNGHQIIVSGVAPLDRLPGEMSTDITHRPVDITMDFTKDIKDVLTRLGITTDNLFGTRTLTLQVQLKDVSTVTFDSNGGSAVGSAVVQNGKTVTKPTDPTRSNYTFQGWFTASSGGVNWNFDDAVIADKTLYAQWKAESSTTDNPSRGGTGGGTTIEDVVTPLANIIPPFISGYPDGTIQPQWNLTRAELATIIFRLYSIETAEISYVPSYTDLTGAHWAYKAIAFCSERGYMQGYPEGDFRPDSAITRAEVATLLQNVKGYIGEAGTLPNDVAGHWAAAKISPLVANGVITGYPDGSFKPDQLMDRAEAVAIICRAEGRDELVHDNVKTFPDLQPGFWAYEYMMHAANGLYFYTPLPVEEPAEKP